MDENRGDPSERSLSALTQTAAHRGRATSPRPSPSVRPVTTPTFECWAFQPFVSAINERAPPCPRGSFATTP